jgi:hypothetical protein
MATPYYFTEETNAEMARENLTTICDPIVWKNVGRP